MEVENTMRFRFLHTGDRQLRIDASLFLVDKYQ